MPTQLLSSKDRVIYASCRPQLRGGSHFSYRRDFSPRACKIGIFSGSSSIDHQFRVPIGKVESIAQGTLGLEDTTMRLVMPTPRERPEALVFETH